MTLSIVILSWNNREAIGNCLRSIYDTTHLIHFEVIVSDNASVDGSVRLIREQFPQVVIIENSANLGFGKGNNAAFPFCRGKWTLILNQDTIVHDGALDEWIEYAQRHSGAGAFGCRVLNLDGSYQGCARPFPTIWREWVAALHLQSFSFLSKTVFLPDEYYGWNGDSERAIDWQAGCALLIRSDLLKKLGGFDERFYFYWEDVDLCRRVWAAEYPILYAPHVTITHLGAQSTKQSPIAFEVDRYKNRYRYFFKYFGKTGVRRCRRVAIARIILRFGAYGLLQLVRPNKALATRLEVYRAALKWNLLVDPIRFVEMGEQSGVPSNPAIENA